MERFLASLMEKKTKTEGKFENEKNLKKIFVFVENLTQGLS